MSQVFYYFIFFLETVPCDDLQLGGGDLDVDYLMCTRSEMDIDIIKKNRETFP